MGNVLANIKLILQILPLIIDTIKAIEAAIPESGAGKAKLDIVRVALQSAYDASNDVIGKFDTIWPMIQNTVGAVVSTFNALGSFKK